MEQTEMFKELMVRQGQALGRLAEQVRLTPEESRAYSLVEEWNSDDLFYRGEFGGSTKDTGLDTPDTQS